MQLQLLVITPLLEQNHQPAVPFEAKFAKPVLQWALRLARHLQLESELLFELWCLPWRRDLEKHGDQGSDFESRPSQIWEGNLHTEYHLIDS